jgi:hypothetical protein
VGKGDAVDRARDEGCVREAFEDETTRLSVWMVMSNPRPPRGSSTGSPSRVRMDGTRVESDDRPAPSKPAASSYERYKQELHAFFNGDKPLPDHLRDMLATRPGASAHGFETDEQAAAAEPKTPTKKPPKKARDTVVADDGTRRRVVAAAVDDVVLIEAIRKASSPREVQTSVDALLARGLSLPKDAEILGKALSHADDAVLEQALAGLKELIVEGSFRGNPTLLKTRLKNVALLSSSGAVRTLCSDVTALL